MMDYHVLNLETSDVASPLVENKKGRFGQRLIHFLFVCFLNL